MRIVTASLLVALMVVGCSDNQPKATNAGRSTDTNRNADAVVIPQRDRSGMDTTSRPVADPMVAMDSGGDPSMRRDTVDGTLVVKGSGAENGEWKFFDVTASLDEQAGGGATMTILQLEAHRMDPSVNFRIRLVSRTGAIHPGTFSLNNPGGDPRVEVSWDANGNYFRDMNGNGAVTITSYDGARVKGTFAFSLPPLNPSAPKTPLTLRGTFDQQVMK